MEESKNYILAILCSDEHIVQSFEQGLSEGGNFANSYNRVMHGKSIRQINDDLSENDSSFSQKKSPKFGMSEQSLS